MTLLPIFTAAALFQASSVFATAQSSGPASSNQGEHYGPGYTDPDSEYDTPSGLQQILSSNSSLWRYPTDFTRNIVPKMLHSHNDYWRDVPFYSALSVGAVSVEADIWLVNGTLHIGHEQSALTASRTLQSLYINPILKTLQGENPSTPFVSGKTKNGVFDTDSTQTLYLWLDCKTEGSSTFRAGIEALQPLREAGYLSSYSPETGVSMSVVTVIGTGNTPESFFSDPTKSRDYFFDADLPEIGSGGAQGNITSNVTLIASVSFGADIGTVGQAGSDAILNTTQLTRLQSQIKIAKAKGIGARYWDTPGWPVRVRNSLWRTFYENGVALINVDDLTAAAFTEW